MCDLYSRCESYKSVTLLQIEIAMLKPLLVRCVSVSPPTISFPRFEKYFLPFHFYIFHYYSDQHTDVATTEERSYFPRETFNSIWKYGLMILSFGTVKLSLVLYSFYIFNFTFFARIIGTQFSNRETFGLVKKARVYLLSFLSLSQFDIFQCFLVGKHSNGKTAIGHDKFSPANPWVFFLPPWDTRLNYK